MGSKLALHFQATPSWFDKAFKDVPYKWAKIIDPPANNIFGDKKCIGRVWIGGDHIEAEYIAQREAGADAYFERCLPTYNRAPWVYIWEGPNEPFVGSPEHRSNLVAFTKRWVQRMHSIGKRAAVYCLSVGWPDTEADCKQLAEGCEEADAIALHEYGAPNMWDGAGWYCLRYRRTRTAMEATGHRIPPFIITETGIDGGVIGQGGKGWRSLLGDETKYMQQLAWYDSELQRDPYVLCATIFTAGSLGWDDFDVTEGLAYKLADHICSCNATSQQPPVAETTTYIFDPRYNIEDNALLAVWSHRPDIRSLYLSNGWTDPLAAMHDWRMHAVTDEANVGLLGYVLAHGWMAMPYDITPGLSFTPTQLSALITTMPCPNFGYPTGTHGRNGHKPIAIVYHVAEGSLAGLDKYLSTSASQVSYHYCVAKDGRIHRYVVEEDAAWHAGTVKAPTWKLYIPDANPNLYTVGICLEGYSGESVPRAQFASLLWLTEDILERWDIEPSHDTLIGHCNINSVERANCPGSGFPWDELFEYLCAEGGLMENLPENEIATDSATLFSKVRWWMEEEQRLREQAAAILKRADAIHLSNIKLAYRAEQARAAGQ